MAAMPAIPALLFELQEAIASVFARRNLAVSKLNISEEFAEVYDSDLSNAHFQDKVLVECNQVSVSFELSKLVEPFQGECG